MYAQDAIGKTIPYEPGCVKRSLREVWLQTSYWRCVMRDVSGITHHALYISLLGRWNLLRNNLVAQCELAILDGDDRHAFLRHMAVGRERDRAGDTGVALGGLDRFLDRGGVGRAGALDRVGDQVGGIVAQRGEGV